MIVGRARLARRLPVLRELQRRALPSLLDRHVVVRIAGWAEAVFQGVRILAPVRYRRVMNWRTATFNRQVAARMRRWPTFDVVVAQQTCALDVFRAAAPGTVRVLNYPIAHHRWMMRELLEEAARNPDWKGSLQGNDFEPEELDRLDREIDLADIVLVASSFVKRTFVENGVPAGKIRVIPLGADVRELSYSADLSGGTPPSPRGLRVLFAGQLTQRKGLSYMLDGFLAAKLEGSTFQLLGSPVGDVLDHIPQRPEIEIRNSVARSELGRLYEQADVLMLTSLAEGFGLVAIEAMSCGTPCILSTSTFADDVVTDGVDGIILEPADATSIAAALNTLAADRPLLARMSAAAKARASEFTWERYSVNAAQLVHDLAGTGVNADDRRHSGPS